MDRVTAALLLTNMLERLDATGPSSGITSIERAALRVALDALGGQASVPATSTVTPVSVVAPPEPPELPVLTPVTPAPEVTAPKLPELKLNVDSLQRSAPSVKDAMLCLDFGTAMSKAYVSVGVYRHLDLALGLAAGYKGHLLPSTMLIGDDCRLYFGQEALDQSERLPSGKRKRIDSIKSRLSQRSDLVADVDTTYLSADENPHKAFDFTHGDMIRIFLAYFVDVAERALSGKEGFGDGAARYVLRRYARPCWPDPQQARAADAKMREMMEQAQILADTFSGQWKGGIPLTTVRIALDKVRELGARPSYLVAGGVPEPVAVAAGAVYDSENARDAYMVVDVGAGTTDFGLFVATRTQNDEVKMHQIAASIRGVMQAGDKIDLLLRAHIAQEHGIDTSDAHGEEIMANLARGIRPMKEILFQKGYLDYVLSDGTVGAVTKDEFLKSSKVETFSSFMESEFAKALESVSDSWLQWLSSSPMRLNVVVTGGSAALDMMQALSKGIVNVRGYKIRRTPVDARPDWIRNESEELQRVYPQLAVAIGGSSDEIPDTLSAPADLKR